MATSNQIRHAMPSSWAGRAHRSQAAVGALAALKTHCPGAAMAADVAVSRELKMLQEELSVSQKERTAASAAATGAWSF